MGNKIRLKLNSSTGVTRGLLRFASDKNIARFASFRKGIAGRETKRNLSVYAEFRMKNCLISQPDRFRIKDAS